MAFVKHFLIYFIFVMAHVTVSSASEEPSQNNSLKKVFAHYVVCCPTYGAGIEDFKREIVDAQKRGVDGFALNVGGWNVHEPYYKKSVTNMYEAARQLGTEFLLFISADGVATDEVEDMMESFSNHPNQFKFGGKFVISTYGGEKLGDPLTHQVHQKGGLIIPSYFSFPATDTPNLADIKFIERFYPEIDGYFYFGAASPPAKISENIAMFAKEFSVAKKIFMAGITPYYRGNARNFRLFETGGFEGMAKEWDAAIKSNSSWVELVTWNDWAESTYLAPIGDASYLKRWGNILPHTAYLDASKFFIDWFKSGQAPVIKKDQLYYFYRLHKKDRVVTVNPADDKAGLGLPKGADKLLDNVYVTLFLPQAAKLEVDSGNRHYEFKVAAGMQNVSMPFGLGVQRFRLIRNSKTIINKVGEHEIKNDTGSRFNYFSGAAQ